MIDRDDELLIGYEAAAAYLGIKPRTLSSYCARGQAPAPYRRVVDGQYVRPVFRRVDLDEWVRNRPGRGGRRSSKQEGV